MVPVFSSLGIINYVWLRALLARAPLNRGGGGIPCPRSRLRIIWSSVPPILYPSGRTCMYMYCTAVKGSKGGCFAHQPQGEILVFGSERRVPTAPLGVEAYSVQGRLPRHVVFHIYLECDKTCCAVSIFRDRDPPVVTRF